MVGLRAKYNIAAALLAILLVACYASAAESSDSWLVANYRVTVLYRFENAFILSGLKLPSPLPSFPPAVVNVTIIVPPTLPWQKVSPPVMLGISPQKIYTDDLGNMYMEYSFNLSGGLLGSMVLGYTTTVTVYPSSGFDESYRTQLGRLTDIPSYMKERYATPTKWFNYSLPEVQSIIQRIRAQIEPPSYLYDVLWSIRNYTVTSVKLAPTSKRQGIDYLVKFMKGDVSEFSDLFVTVSRGFGIPSVRLWCWYLDELRDGFYAHQGYIMPAVWLPYHGWQPFDVTSSNKTARPRIGEISNRIIVFYVESDAKNAHNLLLDKQETFFPGSGTYTIYAPLAGMPTFRAPIYITSYVVIQPLSTVYETVPQFTVTTFTASLLVALPLSAVILILGLYKARKKHSLYKKVFSEIDRRIYEVGKG